MGITKKIKKYPPTNIILRKNNNYFGFLMIERGDDESFYVKPYFYNKNKFENLVKVDDKGKLKDIDISNNLSFKKIENPYISIKKSGKIHVNGFEQTLNKIPIDLDFKSISFNNIDGLLPILEIVSADLNKYRILNRPKNFPFNWIELSNSPLFKRQDNFIGPSFIIFDLDSYINDNENLVVSLFITPSNYEDSVNSDLIKKINGYVTCAHISNKLANKQLLLVFRKIIKKTQNPHTIFMIQPFDKKFRVYKISH